MKKTLKRIFEKMDSALVLYGFFSVIGLFMLFSSIFYSLFFGFFEGTKITLSCGVGLILALQIIPIIAWFSIND